MIKRLSLSNVTVFDSLEMELSPGINVVIGENGAGKTHVLKLAYATLRAAACRRTDALAGGVVDKLIRVFKPKNGLLGDLTRRDATTDSELRIEILDYTDDFRFFSCFSSRSKSRFKRCDPGGFEGYQRVPVFIPTKEVLSFIRDLLAHYRQENDPIDHTYHDLCQDLDTPKKDSARNARATWAMEELESICGGKFRYDDGDVAFKGARGGGTCANTMIAEGHRKLGVLHRLLETQAISPSVSGPLFWDEPEANLNPRLLNLIVRILLELARNGQQIVLSTHNYVLLKEFDVERRESDQLLYHALYRKEVGGPVVHADAEDYAALPQNAIAETFSSLYDRELQKSVGRMQL